MVTLYRRPESPLGDTIQEALEEIVIQHEVMTLASADELPKVDSITVQELPALVDDGVAYTGKDALLRHVDELRELMRDWDRFQADTCEIDEEGRICGHESVRNEDGPGMSVDPTLHPE